MQAPEILCAFSQDPAMQDHLRALWDLSYKDPKSFECILASSLDKSKKPVLDWNGTLQA